MQMTPASFDEASELMVGYPGEIGTAGRFPYGLPTNRPSTTIPTTAGRSHRVQLRTRQAQFVVSNSDHKRQRRRSRALEESCGGTPLRLAYSPAE